MSGHAVVAYGVESETYVKNGVSYNKKILIYDNNAINYNDSYCMYINTSSNRWAIPYYSLDSNDGSIMGLVTNDLNIINYHGYLSGTNTATYDSYISVLSSQAITSDYSLRKINFNSGDWTINAAADDDDIEMFSSLSDDLTESGDVKFALADSSSGYVMQLDSAEALDLSLEYENNLLYATSSEATEVVFNPSGYVEISGVDTDYTINMVFNEGYYDTDWYEFEVTGDNIDTVVMQQVEGGYTLSATSLDGVTASANNDNVSATVSFTTEYTEVYLYEIDERTIGVAVDTDGDGTYETPIAQSETADVTYGDINLDGAITLSDVVIMNKAISGTVTLNDEATANADVNEDNQVDASDTLTLLKFVVQIVDTLPYTG